MSQAEQRVVTFSPFSFDLTSGQLHLRGRLVRISAQNAKVLTILIDARGALVSRDELREKLWPGVEFIDYEHAINKAISQLRTALNDDPRTPRFIETLPRKGYRFAAEIGYAVAPAPIAPAPATPPTAEPSTSEPLKEDAPIERRQRIGRKATAALLLTSILLLIGGAGWLLWRRQAQARATITIGIPPMTTTGAEAPELSERFRLDLSDALATLPEVKVRSIHSFSASPRDNEFMSSLRKEQKLDVLLLGSLSTHDGLCVLTFEVVRGADLTHLASLRYEGTPKQLRGIRERVQQDLFARLKLTSGGEATKGAPTQAAYQAYFEGRRLLSERTDEAINKAILAFKKSLEIDSQFSRGYSGLASSYLLLADRDAFTDGYSMAHNLALRAQELDESNAEAHAILGCIAMSKDWNPTQAEQELRRAVALDPDEAIYHLWLASLLNGEGKFDEALQQVAQAKEDDPYWPPVYQTETMVAGNAGRVAQSLAAAQTLVHLTPTWIYAYDELAWTDWYAGQTQLAATTWTRLAELKGGDEGVSLARQGEQILQTGGVKQYASWRLQHLAALPDSGYHARFLQKAEWQVYAGNNAAAIATIRAMVKAHDPSIIQVGVDPAFRALSATEDFKAAYSTAGLHIKLWSKK